MHKHQALRRVRVGRVIAQVANRFPFAHAAVADSGSEIVGLALNDRAHEKSRLVDVTMRRIVNDRNSIKPGGRSAERPIDIFHRRTIIRQMRVLIDVQFTARPRGYMIAEENFHAGRIDAMKIKVVVIVP